MCQEKKTDISSMVARGLPNAGLPIPLTGEDIRQFGDYFGLALTEIGMAMGLNTAALYGKKREAKPLSAHLSVLLRLWCIFHQHIPRVQPPSIEDLIARIQEIEPDFMPYSIGPTLGLETNSGYRLIEGGLDDANQSTRILVWLIYTVLGEDKANWEIIKETLYTQARANQIEQPQTIWKKGGWSRYVKKAEAGTTKGEPAGAPTREKSMDTQKESGYFTKQLKRKPSVA